MSRLRSYFLYVAFADKQEVQDIGDQRADGGVEGADQHRISGQQVSDENGQRDQDHQVLSDMYPGPLTGAVDLVAYGNQVDRDKGGKVIQERRQDCSLGDFDI